jgi:hypothetical protein
MNLKLVAATVVLSSLVIVQASKAASLVVNGSFETTTSSFGAGDKYGFSAAGVTGWSGGTGLTFLDAPGTADNVNDYLAVYGPFPATSPDGGNFVEADGDPNYSSAIYQTISGLTAGDVYDVSFYQAAGQQIDFTGPTTEKWAVTLGGTTLDSSKFSLPQGGVGAWQAQTLAFTANSSSEVLSFLAVGTPGGAPPISFLDGVSVTAVPLPTALSLAFVGMIGIAAYRSRRTAQSAAAN